MLFRGVLGAWMVVFAMTAWWSTTHADTTDSQTSYAEATYSDTAYRDREEEDCKAACEVQREQCVDVCGAHRNPVECDSQCRDDAIDCSRNCH
jgi:hypothetical protein